MQDIDHHNENSFKPPSFAAVGEMDGMAALGEDSFGHLTILAQILAA